MEYKTDFTDYTTNDCTKRYAYVLCEYLLIEMFVLRKSMFCMAGHSMKTHLYYRLSRITGLMRRDAKMQSVVDQK